MKNSIKTSDYYNYSEFVVEHRILSNADKNVVDKFP